MTSTIIDEYINQLITDSTPEIPVWNKEKALSGKKSGWDYIDGCMILALLAIYDTSGLKKYLEFADQYENYRIHDDGTIDGYEKKTWNLDDINGGKNLISLYSLTGKMKYRLAADKIYEQICEQPRTPEGNFWHKKIYPEQVWLDGMYMALPFYMEYDCKFNQGNHASDIYKQFFTVQAHMKDTQTGLYYHAWDSSHKSFWCNKNTGLSAHFWLRSIGWFAMALLDTLQAAPDKTCADWNLLKNMFTELMNAMITMQDASGMWYQIPNYPGKGKNYLETSGSAIMAYSLLKGVRTGILPVQYRATGIKTFEGICNTNLKTASGGKMNLTGICLVAGLGPENNTRRDGSFEYYMSEPVVEDDAKGVGPFILAYNEWRQIS